MADPEKLGNEGKSLAGTAHSKPPDAEAIRTEGNSTMPAWAAPFGALAGTLTAILLIVLLYHPPTTENVGLTAAIIALGLAMSFGFLGGSVGVKFRLPLVKAHPMGVSAAGGIAVFLAAWPLGSFLLKPPEAAPEAVAPATPATPAGPPGSFALRLELREAEPPQRISFRAAAFSEYFALQEVGYYLVRGAPFPLPGRPFDALFRPAALDSRLLEKGEGVEKEPPTVRLCVTLNAQAKRYPEQDFAHLVCSYSGGCNIGQSDPGWVSECGTPQPFGFLERIIPAAHAQTSARAARDEKYWVGASLQTLRERQKVPGDEPAYMEFSIDAQPRGDVGWLGQVSHTRMEVRVNGVPVRFDGWRPEENEEPFSGTLLHREFGLQNLGFSGAKDGWETLTVSLAWIDKQRRVIKTTSLERTMVAFRDADVRTVAWEGLDFRWEGRYQPSTVHDRFSLMAVSTTSKVEANYRKTRIDGIAERLGENEIVGVVRPPLTPWRLQNWSNDHYSVLLGLQRPSGQIAFAFSEAEASDYCQRMVGLLDRYVNAGAVHSSLSRFAWPEAGSQGKPKPGRYVACSSL